MTQALERCGIGRLRERSLHASLRAWYARPGDAFEADVDGYRVDIVRGNDLIEVQTCAFAAIRPKLEALLRTHSVTLVYPLPVEKWIVRLPAEGVTPTSRRRSPKRGRVTDVFDELVHVAALFRRTGPDRLTTCPPGRTTCSSLRLQVVFTREEEVRREDGRGSWRRRGASIVDRRLLEVVASRTFACPADYAALLPAGLTGRLPDQDGFACRELAHALNLRLTQARRMVYCLHAMAVLEQVGKRGRERLWRPAAI